MVSGIKIQVIKGISALVVILKFQDGTLGTRYT